MKIELTKERILKMAETCPTVKNALKAGFPEAFEEEGEFKVGDKFDGLGCTKWILVETGHNEVMFASLNDGSAYFEKKIKKSSLSKKDVTSVLGSNWKKIN